MTHWQNIGADLLRWFVVAGLVLGLVFVPETAAEYKKVTGPCHLRFPEDHGPHPDYRTEWWYYTGNAQSADGAPYGFQLTFFRSRLNAPAPAKQTNHPTSAWRSEQIYLAHAALTDIQGRQHLFAEDTARGVLGMAGARRRGQKIEVHLNRWSASIEPTRHRLNAFAEDFAFDLTLVPLKAPVLHGQAGYSRKGSAPHRASCYYSFTRLALEGTITHAEKTVSVTGLAWMDHEFSTASLEPGLKGWDWFSLQLSDRSELMLYLLLQSDGSPHPASSGSYVDATGEIRHLTLEQIDVVPLRTWQSPHSQAVYPASWRVRVPSLALDLTVNSNLPDQEMRTTASTQVTYWEGSVHASGHVGPKPVTGMGYVELTGYAHPLDAPI